MTFVKSESNPKPTINKYRKIFQYRSPGSKVDSVQVVVPHDYKERSKLYCSSPTISEQGRGVKKADVCRCHGTLNHKIFRRDTTPEYTAGDSCRPPTVPIIQNNKSGKDKLSNVPNREESSFDKRKASRRHSASDDGSRKCRHPSPAESNQHGNEVTKRTDEDSKLQKKGRCVHKRRRKP